MNAVSERRVLGPVTGSALEKTLAIRAKAAELPQVEFPIEHHIHAGCYSRTVYIPKGMAAFGTMIRIPTQLIVSGHCLMNAGNETTEVKGYKVFDGAPGRIQTIVTLEDTYMTMVFASQAKTPEEAEDEFTDEAEMLQTRKR